MSAPLTLTPDEERELLEFLRWNWIDGKYAAVKQLATRLEIRQRDKENAA